MFYNEQCSFSDSGKIPSRKTGLKTKRSAQSAQPWPARAPSAQATGAPRLRPACRAPRLPRARSLPCACRALPRACRLPCAPSARTPLSHARPNAHLRPAPAHPRTPASALRAPSVPSCPVLGHNTPRCIATQFPLAKPAGCNTRDCIAIQSSHSQPLACNTIPSLASHLTLQYKIVLQYNLDSSQIPYFLH